ncbi:MAG: phosphoribosylglycinamide formyltransferase [Bacteroidales bacterium]|nr:phosphoribosylglycinamide formyltransferase [Bacteroidales bacterium]
MKNIAIFASGNGTNAQRIIEYFIDSKNIKVSLVLSNKNDAYVLVRAKKFNILSVVFNRNEFYNTELILDKLKLNHIDFIVLAGFLWLIPHNILREFKGRIINIHPALLPKYGGKGMYGMNVHKTVIEANEKESGISIHYVNEKYDEGEIIFQVRCPVEKGETQDSLAEKIHKLEYEFFPKLIEQILTKSKIINN